MLAPRAAPACAGRARRQAAPAARRALPAPCLSSISSACTFRMERLAQLVGALVHRRQLLAEHTVHARFGFGERTTKQRATGGRTGRIPSCRWRAARRWSSSSPTTCDSPCRTAQTRARIPRRAVVAADSSAVVSCANSISCRIFGAGQLLAAVVQLGDLRIHRPDHLVQPIHSTTARSTASPRSAPAFCDTCSASALSRSTAPRCSCLVPAAAAGPSFFSISPSRLGGRRRILLGLARRFANPLDLGGELRASRSNGVELAPQRADGVDELDDFNRRCLQLRAEMRRIARSFRRVSIVAWSRVPATPAG